jgi:hypothetical protein
MQHAFRRSVGALSALLAFAISGASSVVHPCPAHTSATSHEPAPPKSHDGMAMHHGAAETEAPADGHAACQCLDCGCIGATATIPVAAEIAVATGEPGSTPPAVGRMDAPARRIAHALPFSIGPPNA